MKVPKYIEAAILMVAGAAISIAIWASVRAKPATNRVVRIEIDPFHDPDYNISFVYDQQNPVLQKINSLSTTRDQNQALQNETSIQPTKSRSVSEFGHKLQKKFAQLEPEKNQVFSPLSFKIVLTMAAFGAAGNTERQLREVTGIQNSWHVEASYFKGNLTGLEKSGVQISNKVYITEKFPLKPEYTDALKNELNAATEQINFTPSATAADRINDWVSNATKGKITKLMAEDSFDETTALVLLNTIHFKGGWKVAFNTSRTRKANFQVSPHKTVQVDMMFLDAEIEDKERLLSTAYTRDYKAVQLPYEGDRLSMLIFVPNESKTVSAVHKELGTKSVESLLKSFEVALDGGGLYVPKFKIESKIPAEQIKAALVELGLTDMFDKEEANFSGILVEDKYLYVSKVVHKAVIEVNEEGTEAAAATGMEMRAESVPIPFKVDRSFVFMVVDKSSGSVLFTGTCHDPTALGISIKHSHLE